MGLWDVVYYTGDLLTPVKSTVKRAGSDAVTKIDEVVGIKKLHDQYWPDDQQRGQILHFTSTFAKNTLKYALYQGYKHIPGATVARKLILETMRDVEQTNRDDGIKSTSQPESSNQNSELSSQNAVQDKSEKTKIARSRM
ncbi:hypothetical protein M8C21_025001 [Ambrosia artemisiifolia]|uniref:Uncharacterized protein n=1 Tax=Ambrosia artemisiifolia TaxID=4212 RepID=A0AAD5C104_AMBAR|nr:hypothetical protein M8C21_025001 [Ambrosia artemisiifolia]